jgi:hypothetical protein
MLKTIFLKFKSQCYVSVLGLLNIFALSYFSACSNNSNNKKDNAADSIARVKRINDSLMKREKYLHDSINNALRIQDSLNNINQIKNNYKPSHNVVKYGIMTTDYKKLK